MRTPPGIIGLSLLFWGLQTGYLWAGIPAAVLLEAGRYLKWQWNIEEKDFQRLWDFCVVVYAALVVYVYNTVDILESPYLLARWAPMIFLPMIAALWFGPLEALPYRTFWWFWRKGPSLEIANRKIDLSYLYLAICLFASTSTPKNRPFIPYFYAGFCILSGWALTQVRPRRIPWAVWGLLLVLIISIGYGGHILLSQAQNYYDARIAGWFYRLGTGQTNSKESRTAIGQIGRLKLSTRIMLRLESNGTNPPALLREASYESYQSATWRGTSKDFQPVQVETNDVWTLLPHKTNSAALTIGGSLKRGRGVLALPGGVTQISHLPAAEVERSRLGVVRVAKGPRFVNYTTLYGPGATLDSAPQKDDFAIPESEKPGIDQIMAQLNIKGSNTLENMTAIERHFLNNYQYSLITSATSSKKSPLAEFLLNRRTGHCEYFATATVLLLRAAGIPARYAVGYSVQESTGKNRYIVREKHAHAWALVYRADRGYWEDFDTTPPGWVAAENRGLTWFQSLRDHISNIWFEFNKWRYGQNNLSRWVIWIIVLALAYFGWRLFSGKTKRRKTLKEATLQQPKQIPGADSEFYLIEQELMKQGVLREKHETVLQWLDRMKPSQPHDFGLLAEIVELHYQYRFDPSGLSIDQRKILSNKAQLWLKNDMTSPMAINANKELIL